MSEYALKDLVTELHNAIERESAALAARDFDSLSEAIAIKTDILNRVEHERRQTTIDGVSLDADTRELLQACAIQNRVNGGAIALCRNMVDGLFNTLNGGAQTPRLYDAGGNVRQTGHGRRVGYA